MAQLNFVISNQVIRRTDDFYVVADSHDYLRAHFDFASSEWDGVEKTALFSRSGGQAYEMLIVDGECDVPHEVLAGAGLVTVSVFGGSLITVNTATIEVAKSGYIEDAEHSTDPTPGIYEQILDHVSNLEDIAEQVGDAFEAAERAETAAGNAQTAQTAAETAAQSAGTHDTSAGAYAQAAQTAAAQAEGYRDQAGVYANSAHQDAERAEQAAGVAGYMFVEIVDGHLIYERTDQVDVDFELDGGHLYMEGV